MHGYWFPLTIVWGRALPITKSLPKCLIGAQPPQSDSTEPERYREKSNGAASSLNYVFGSQFRD